MECDVRVEDSFVQPLYKHIININYPTMVFIGLIVDLTVFRLLDLQVIVTNWIFRFKSNFSNHEIDKF